MPAQVMIVCPVRLYREGLAASLLELDGRALGAVAAVAAVADAVELAEADCPRVILLDTAVPDLTAGMHALRRAMPRAAILLFGLDEADDRWSEPAGAGIAGYLSHTTSLDQLYRCVKRAARGGALDGVARNDARLERATGASVHATGDVRVRRLTHREREVIELIERGFSNEQIARALSIRLPTVKNHVHSILEKLGVSRRSAAAAALRRTRAARPATA